MAKKITVQINYKSGLTMKIVCEKFTVTRAVNGAILSISYNGVSPVPLHMGVSEIESVWEL